MKFTPRKTQNEMIFARGRLRGALNDSIHLEDDYDLELPQRGRPSKRQLIAKQEMAASQRNVTPQTSPRKSIQIKMPIKKSKKAELKKAVAAAKARAQKLQSESFVMKLFDRSLDLSKYKADTSLYPICRAWMANQPRTLNVHSYRDRKSPVPVKREHNGDELVAKLRRREIYEVNSLPAIKHTEMPVIPPHMTLNEVEKREAEQLKGASKHLLMAHHMVRWKKVKHNWMEHAREYIEQRYEDNDLIIDLLMRR